MHPGGGNVLEVVVANVGRQLGDGAGQIFTHAKRVAHVEVKADRGRIQSLGDFEVLIGRFQQQVWLWLDQEQDAPVVGMVGKRL